MHFLDPILLLLCAAPGSIGVRDEHLKSVALMGPKWIDSIGILIVDGTESGCLSSKVWVSRRCTIVSWSFERQDRRTTGRYPSGRSSGLLGLRIGIQIPSRNRRGKTPVDQIMLCKCRTSFLIGLFICFNISLYIPSGPGALAIGRSRRAWSNS